MTENNELSNSNKTILTQLEESEPQIKKFSWTPFALILICFSLPFLEVSCQGKQITSLSGFQTAFGTQISGPTQVQEIPGTPILVFVLLITLVCLVIPFLKLKFNHLIAAIGSGFSLLLLLIAKWIIDNESIKEGGGLITIQVAYGYIFIFCLFILGSLTHGFLHQAKMKKTISSIPEVSGEETPFASSSITPAVEFDIVSWISKNKTLVIVGTTALSGLLFVGLFFYGSFWLFLSHTPEGDAKTASANYCGCQESYNAKLIALKKEFLTSFDSYKFKTQEEATQKLQKLESTAGKELNICNNQAKANYTELRNRYLQNKIELERFEKLFEAQKDTCSPTNQLKLSEISDEAEEKISDMKINADNFSVAPNLFNLKNQPPQINQNTNTEEKENIESEDVESNQLQGCQNGQNGYFTGGNVRTSPQHSQNIQNIIAIVDPNAELRILGNTTGEARQSTGNTNWYKVKFLNGFCHFDQKQNLDVDSCAIQNLSVGFVNADLVLGCR